MTGIILFSYIAMFRIYYINYGKLVSVTERVSWRI